LFVYSFIHSFAYSFIHSSIYPSIYPSVHPSIHTFIHLCQTTKIRVKQGNVYCRNAHTHTYHEWQ